MTVDWLRLRAGVLSVLRPRFRSSFSRAILTFFSRC
jgi:hypothetical protein